MVAWSSLLRRAGVRTVPYNCYEIGHTWSSDCSLAIYMFTEAIFKESVKLYVIFYVISFLLKRKKFTMKNMYKLLASISQSTLFLTSTGFFYLFYTCAVRFVLGEFNTLTASFVPAMFCNMTCISLERADRTSALASYVTNAALETLYRMLVYRNILPIIPHGEVILFSGAMALYMYHISKNGPIVGDLLSKVLKILLSSSGGSATVTCHGVNKENNDKRIFGSIFWLNSFWTSRVGLRLKSLPRHATCPHMDSCILTCTYGFLRAFTLAYACQCALSVGKQLFRNPRHLFRALLDKRNFKLGLFLGLFTGTFKGVSCFLRWVENKDSSWHAIPAGFLAGLAMYFNKSAAVAIYAAWRIVELIYERGVQNRYLRYSKLGTALLYSFSASILFHAGVVEPHNLSPRYYKFLSTITRGLVDQVNRHLMEVLGVGSSTNFKHFLPILDKSRMTPAGVAQMMTISSYCYDTKSTLNVS